MFDDNGSYFLALLQFFIFVAWLVCLFWIFGDLFRSRDLGGLAKTLWTLFIIFLPTLGALVYLIARGGGMSERAAAAHSQLQQQQEAYIRSVAGSGAAAGPRSATDEIARAKELLDSGTISAAEFEHLKAKALGTAPVAG
ncbi:SHOCT domain-containing protein [Actinoplanes aureus]|uniref:SHOCT domain-containing protein n=1 Tax=Actinoplanes aureus TaxID=2792083 RepID=A0A931C786_9ACTN|nr:SHOCT domain-containing protein [Actinoplanes aureus]MBG0564710.1 SHOCT domain-containing protein [Actinoplanes aureus]